MEKLINYLAYFVIGYALLTLFVFFIQRSLIYIPDHSTPTKEYLQSMGLRYWPNSKGYKGYISTRNLQTINGVAIVFHGNAGSAQYRDYFIHALEPLGYRVILAEYPGYGGRDGKMSEKSFVNDAMGIIEKAQAEFGGPIYLIGESMGSAVAAAVVADRPESIAGLILITPWDSLPSLAQTHYWYLPARWLVKDRFDSAANLHDFTRPVAVALAENDNIVPNKHTLKLYQAINGPKRLWRFDNAGHNDWPTNPTAPWWKEAMAFVAYRK